MTYGTISELIASLYTPVTTQVVTFVSGTASVILHVLLITPGIMSCHHTQVGKEQRFLNPKGYIIIFLSTSICLSLNLCWWNVCKTIKVSCALLTNEL